MQWRSITYYLSLGKCLLDLWIRELQSMIWFDKCRLVSTSVHLILGCAHLRQSYRFNCAVHYLIRWFLHILNTFVFWLNFWILLRIDKNRPVRCPMIVRCNSRYPVLLNGPWITGGTSSVFPNWIAYYSRRNFSSYICKELPQNALKIFHPCSYLFHRNPTGCFLLFLHFSVNSCSWI